MTRLYRIGTGAGFSADRLDPAVELVRHGKLDAIVFECLGERTLAFAHRDRLRDPAAGYNPLLARRMAAMLPLCREHGTRLLTNMGAANPRGAAERTVQIARELGLDGLRVAVIEGDDVSAAIAPDTLLPELGTAGSGGPAVGTTAVGNTAGGNTAVGNTAAQGVPGLGFGLAAQGQLQEFAFDAFLKEAIGLPLVLGIGSLAAVNQVDLVLGQVEFLGQDAFQAIYALPETLLEPPENPEGDFDVVAPDLLVEAGAGESKFTDVALQEIVMIGVEPVQITPQHLGRMRIVEGLPAVVVAQEHAGDVGHPNTFRMLL